MIDLNKLNDTYPIPGYHINICVNLETDSLYTKLLAKWTAKAEPCKQEQLLKEEQSSAISLASA